METLYSMDLIQVVKTFVGLAPQSGKGYLIKKQLKIKHSLIMTQFKSDKKELRETGHLP